MSKNPLVREAFVISIFVAFALAFASAPAAAGQKTSAPGSKEFGEIKVVGPTTAPGSLSVPSKVQGLPPAGMLKSKAALPMAPKHYKLDPEAGAVRFGDGQQGARLPSGHPPKDGLVLGNIGASGAPPPKGPGALGSLPLPPPQGVSPADPTSPPLPGGASEKGIIVQTAPDASPAGDTVPTDNISLNFKKIKEDYTPQDSGKGGGNVGADWKVEEGVK